MVIANLQPLAFENLDGLRKAAGGHLQLAVFSGFDDEGDVVDRREDLLDAFAGK